MDELNRKAEEGNMNEIREMLDASSLSHAESTQKTIVSVFKVYL